MTAYEGWAICEQMGFKKTVGKIAEVEMYGAKLLRIDRPYFKLEDGEMKIDGWVTEFAGGPSIYNITPVSEEIGINLARERSDPRPVRPVEYRLEHKPELIPEPPPAPSPQEWRPSAEERDPILDDADFDEVDDEEIAF